MCLHTLNEVYEEGSYIKTKTTGYKVVIGGSGGMYHTIYRIHIQDGEDTGYEIGETYYVDDNDDFRVQADFSNAEYKSSYDVGFHVYRNLSDAIAELHRQEGISSCNIRILQVTGWNITAEGEQKIKEDEYKHRMAETFVCRNMKIEKEVEI